MPRKILHEIGTEVFAKWPGSAMYYPGSVVEEYDKESDSYMVKFDNEGDPIQIAAKNVSKPSQVKSWRSRSASPARASGRTKRRRSRSKSPSRTSRQRSPARKNSPGRKKEKKQLELEKDSSPVKEEAKTEEVAVEKASDKEDDGSLLQKNDEVEETNIVKEQRSSTVVTRRVTRSVARIQAMVAEVKEDDKKEDVEKEEKQYGFAFHVLALLSILLMLLVMLALCFISGDKQQGFAFYKWPKLPPVSSFLNWKVFLAVGVWVDLQFILTKLPFGKVIQGPLSDDGEQLSYRANGFLTLLLHMVVFGIHIYTKYAFKIAALVDQYYLAIATSCIILTVLIALQVAMKSSYNSSAKYKSFLPANFLMGTEPNPTILTFDFKLCCVRTGVTSWCVLILMSMAHHYSATDGKINCAAVAVAVFQLIYTLGIYYFLEENLYTSPSMKELAVGFGTVYNFIIFTPFFYSMQVQFLVATKPQLSATMWTAVLILNILGTYIFFKSNTEKAEFRSDLKKAMKRDVKVVFTEDGRNILADGWWGRLRHPNYLGDILISISWALPAGFSHLLPWLYPIFLVALLVGFAIEDEKRCAKKYGLSWDEYKARVKYVIIPYVF